MTQQRTAHQRRTELARRHFVERLRDETGVDTTRLQWRSGGADWLRAEVLPSYPDVLDELAVVQAATEVAHRSAVVEALAAYPADHGVWVMPTREDVGCFVCEVGDVAGAVDLISILAVDGQSLVVWPGTEELFVLEVADDGEDIHGRVITGVARNG